MQGALPLLRRISRLWVAVTQTALVILCVLIGAAIIVLPRYNPPVTVVSQPAAAAPILALREPVVLTFSAAMNQSSVAQALQILPETPVSLVWNSASTVVHITPATTWRADQSYTIALDATARSATRANVESWRSAFSTRAFLRVSQMFPRNLATDIAPSEPIIVRFSQQMVPRSRAGTTLTIPLVQLSPPHATTQRWLDTQTLLVRTEPAFTPATRYRITIPAGTTDSAGRALQQAVTQLFTTAEPRQFVISPADGATNVAAATPITYRLPGSWDAAQLRQAVTITPAVAYTIDIRPLDGETLVDIRPQQTWAPDTTYTVTQLPVVDRFDGFTSHFQTAPHLLLVAQSPADGLPLQANRELRFVFNTTLNPATAAAAVHFSPPPLRPAQIDVQGNTLRIRGTWASQSAPVIRVDQSLRGTAGYGLAADLIQTFAIDPRATTLSLPGTRDRITDISAENRLAISMSPHTQATLTISALPAETIAGMYGRTSMQWDPVFAGITPLITIPLSTELEPIVTVDLRSAIPEPPARVLFAHVVDSAGASDSRFIRVIPSNIISVPIADALVIAVPPAADQPPPTFSIYQGGKRIRSGTDTETGIWRATDLPVGPVFIADDRTPFDIVAATVGIPQPSQRLAVFPATQRITTTMSLHIACARTDTARPASGTITLSDADDTTVRNKPITWRSGEAVASVVTDFPDTSARGAGRVTCRINDLEATTPILITPVNTADVTIQRRTNAGTSVVIVHDAANRPVTDATVHWFDGNTSLQAVVDSAGAARVPATIPSSALAIQSAQTRYRVTGLQQPTIAMSAFLPWYPAQTEIPITIDTALPAATVDLAILDGTGTLHRRETLTTDAQGRATTQHTLPDGTWDVRLSTPNDSVSSTLTVGGTPPAPLVAASFSADAPSGHTWISAAPISSPALLVERIDHTLTARWSTEPGLTQFSTTPLSDTTTIAAAYGTYTATAQSAPVPIMSAACAAARLTVQRTASGTFQVTLVGPPSSTVLLSSDAADGAATGFLRFAIPTSGLLETTLVPSQQPHSTVRALIHAPQCLHVLTTDRILPSATTLRLDTPDMVAIGDVVPVSVRITGLMTDTTTPVTLDSTDCVVVDPLPVFSLPVAADGTATATWHVRILRAHPTLSVTHPLLGTTHWRPTLLPSPRNDTADGFVLTGRSTVETARGDTLIDILTNPTDLANAIAVDSAAQPTAAHRAHQLWFDTTRHDTSALRRSLLHSQQTDGGWGDEGLQTSDPLITADVALALTRSGTSDPRRPQRIAALRRAAEDTSLPLTVRALTIHALAAQGERTEGAFHALYALRATMGSEGVAALILAAPLYPDSDPRPLIDVLATRATPASRGVLWEVDPTTATLHSSAAQNIMIFSALVDAGAPQALIDASRAYIVSARGTAGWGDSIANARAWAVHRTLFPVLSGTQRVTMTDRNGRNLGTGALARPLQLQSAVSIWSDAPVVVGIDYPRDLTPPTQQALIATEYTDSTGAPLAHLALLPIGSVVTVTTDIIVLTELPYLRITIPRTSLTTNTFVSVPEHFVVDQTPTGTTLIPTDSRPGVWRIVWRIRADRRGTAHVPGITITDATGTLHAATAHGTLYVGDR